MVSFDILVGVFYYFDQSNPDHFPQVSIYEFFEAQTNTFHFDCFLLCE